MLLFNKLKFTPQEYEQYVQHMDLSMSIVNIVSALMHAQSKGVFNLNESEIVAKSIRVLEENLTETPSKNKKK